MSGCCCCCFLSGGTVQPHGCSALAAINALNPSPRRGGAARSAMWRGAAPRGARQSGGHRAGGEAAGQLSPRWFLHRSQLSPSDVPSAELLPKVWGEKNESLLSSLKGGRYFALVLNVWLLGMLSSVGRPLPSSPCRQPEAGPRIAEAASAQGAPGGAACGVCGAGVRSP